jgi:hypothetical protein
MFLMRPTIPRVIVLRKLPSLLVNLLRIKDTLGDEFQPFGGHLSEEAGGIAFVAGRAPRLPYFEQNCIAVAIDVHRFDMLDVAALFTFAPELAA